MTVKELNVSPLVRLENIELSLSRKRGMFGKQTSRILDNVNLTIGRGEIVAVVGESGSGKTTLGKALLRLYQPTGKILFDDRDLAALSGKDLRTIRHQLQMVFQDPLSSFNPRFKIGSSIALPLMLHGFCKTKKDAQRRSRELLEEVGLNPDLCDRFPHEMSGGQLQRVAIARAIGIQPKLIVADEAVSKLDVSVRAQVLNLIRRANENFGVAFLFITHDLAVARFLSDRIAVMFNGRIVEVGETESVFSHPQHPYTASLLGARTNTNVVEADNLEALSFDINHACNFAARCERRQEQCLRERPQLELKSPQQTAACFFPLSPANHSHSKNVTGGDKALRS